MARVGGNPGNKGGGRKSARDERIVMDVINKSWERVLKNLTGERLKEQEKDIVALEVVKRTAPKSIDLTSKGNELNPVLVKFLNEPRTNNRDTK